MKKLLTLLFTLLLSIGASWASTYTKVTSTNDLESGAHYLIVYETGNVIFDGSLTSLDKSGNTQSVTISDNTIEADDKYSFVITESGTSYTIQSASSYYIGSTASSKNELLTSTSTVYTNTIAFSGDDVTIVGSGGGYLRYNKNSSDLRFRYFKSTSYTNQQAIQLYKKQSTTDPTLSVSEESLTLTKKEGESDPTATFNVTFANLTGGITLSCDNSAFTISPTSIEASATSPQEITVTFTGTEDATGTITVADATDNLSKTVTLTGNYKAAGESVGYTKVTSADQLVAGYSYIIVYEGGPTALSGFGSGGTGTDVTISNNEIDISDTGVIEFTLGGSKDAWTLSYDDSGTTKYLKTAEKPSAATTSSTWTIASSDDGYYLQYTSSSKTYTLRYNSSASTGPFRCYSSTTGSIAYLYYKANNSPTLKVSATSLEVPVVVGSTSGTATFTVSGKKLTGDVTITSDNTNFTVAPSSITVGEDGTAAETTITVTYNGNTNGETGTITISSDGATSKTVTVTSVVESLTASITESTTFTGSTFTGAITAKVGDATATEGVTYYYKIGDATEWSTSTDGSFTVTAKVAYNGTESETVTATYTREAAAAPSAPTISPSSQAIEDDDITVTITGGSDATSIVYVLDGGEEVTVEGNTATITLAGGSAHTLTAYAVNSEGTRSSAATGTYTHFESEEYEMMTSVDDLSAGETYLIVYKASDDATSAVVMGAIGSNGYGAKIEATETDEHITSTTEMAVVTLGGESGKWTLTTSEGVLTGGSKSLKATKNGTETWTITKKGEDDNTYEIVPASTSGYYLQYNSSSPRFACYAGTQQYPYIYKVANTTQVKKPVITLVDGTTTFIGIDTVQITDKTEGATIYYSLDNENFTKYEGTFVIGSEGNTENVTVYAYAADETGTLTQSETVSVTFTASKPEAPTFGDNEAGAYINAVNVYPKSTLDERKKYGSDAITFYYTTDGTTPTTASTKVESSNSNGVYIPLWKNTNLQVVKVINGVASEAAGGEYTFSVDAVAYSLASGTYSGEQTTALSTGTKATGNTTKKYTTKIYYSITTDEENSNTIAIDTSTGEPTDATVWSEYASKLSFDEGHTYYVKAYAVSNYMDDNNAVWTASELTSATYSITAATIDIIFDPRAGTYTNTENVMIEVAHAVGDYTLYYTTDGSDPSDESNTARVKYEEGATITVDQDMTIRAYCEDSRDHETVEGGKVSESAAYRIGVQDVEFSPDGTHNGLTLYYDSEYAMKLYTVSENATIYYTVLRMDTTDYDASKIDEYWAQLEEPTSASNVYDGTQALQPGKVTFIKAIAYVGNKCSGVTKAFYILRKESSAPTVDGETNAYTVAEMNKLAKDVSCRLVNPVQVIWFSTYQNNGTKPEFLYVRDNTDHGCIYFGGPSVSKYTGSTTIFGQGAWLASLSVMGTTNVWTSNFHTQLGTSSGAITDFPTDSIGYDDVIPSVTTNTSIAAGTTDGTNEWGRYVHLKKCLLSKVADYSSSDAKHKGTITDQSGTSLVYYDKFYLWSGHDNALGDYDQEFFDSIQNNGGCFGVYGIVDYYASEGFEICPIDFVWIYQPYFYSDEGVSRQVTTAHDYSEPVNETQTIYLHSQTTGAEIYYKTSSMADYELYTTGSAITISKTDTILTYSRIPTKYNDHMESLIDTLIVTFKPSLDPVISPESQVNDKGAEVTATIYFENGEEQTVTYTTSDGNTEVIYYTTDGSDPSTSETRQQYTSGTELKFTETTTVRAIGAVLDGSGNVLYYSNEAEPRTYTFVSSNGIIYDRVKELNENMVYVIVNCDKAMGMSTTQNETNRGAEGVKFVENSEDQYKQVYGNDDLALFTVSKGENNTWYFHAENDKAGYLAVGDGNILTTVDAIDEDGNCNVTVTFDDDSVAHLQFMYNNTTYRYLRFYNNGQVFSNYASETSGLPVRLYGTAATPLKTIEADFENETQVTVADELQVMWIINHSQTIDGTEVNTNLLIARDLAQSNEYSTNDEGATDYVEMSHLQDADKVTQNNWVVLRVEDKENASWITKFAVGDYIKAGTITGTYYTGAGYTITLLQEPEKSETASTTAAYNEYVVPNFMTYGDKGNYLTGEKEDKPFFFMNPKIDEVAHLQWMMWNGNTFALPNSEAQGLGEGVVPNAYSLNADALNINWFLNENGDKSYGMPTGTLKTDYCYEFYALIEGNIEEDTHQSARRKAPRRASKANGFTVYPLNLKSDAEPTSIEDVLNKLTKEVAGVMYYNVAGAASETPFEGVNIVVTTYTDGTRSTAKVIR